MAECTVNIMKWMLVITNTLFVFVGIAIIVHGALAWRDISYYKGTDVDISWIAIAVIVIGGMVAIIAFLGCCGAMQEQRCMLITYGTVSLVILMTGVGLGIWTLTTPNTVQFLLSKDQMKRWFDDQLNNTQQTSTIVTNLQIALECCGVNGPMDYSTLHPSKETPRSCCSSILENIEQERSNCPHIEIHKTGCYEKLTHLLESLIKNFGIEILSLGVFNVLAIAFAFCLASHFKDD